MIWKEEECRQLVKRVLDLAKADEVEVSLGGGESAGSRFANNQMTQNLSRSNLTLTVSVVIENREGSASTNFFDEASIRRTVESAQDVARLSRASRERVPLVKGPQQYGAVTAWFQESAQYGPLDRARHIKTCIDICRDRKLIGSGYLSKSESFGVYANSAGIFFYRVSTSLDFSMTVRTPDRTGSGWASAEGMRKLSDLRVEAVAQRACEKAERSRSPVEIPPGKYTVILEPAAASTFLGILMGAFEARAADEGRSWMSEGRGETKLNKKVLGEQINIRSDPFDARLLGSPMMQGGLPALQLTWVEKGVIENLAYSRYWAAQKGKEPTGFPNDLLMEGAEASVEDIIAATERGVLITHMWYVRTVDPRTLLYTGLTRDGLFLVENGKLTKSLVNFRWNESPAHVFNSVTMLGRQQRLAEMGGASLVPALRVDNFNFHSISPSV